MRPERGSVRVDGRSKSPRILARLAFSLLSLLPSTTMDRPFGLLEQHFPVDGVLNFCANAGSSVIMILDNFPLTIDTLDILRDKEMTCTNIIQF